MTYNLLLSCLHSRKVNVKQEVGDGLYCRRCGEYVTVIAGTTDPIKNKCDSCIFAPEFGQMLRDAQASAYRHTSIYAGHVVTIIIPNREPITVDAGDALPLPSHNGHQRALRTVVRKNST